MAAEERLRLARWLRERTGSVRLRTTAVAVIVVGVALVTAAIAMVALLRRALTGDVQAAARLRAQAVADQVGAGRTERATLVADQEEEFVQVLGSRATVVASSANLAGRPPVTQLPPGESIELSNLPFEDDPFLVLAARVPSPDGTRTILVGRTLETVAESTGAVRSLLAAGLPLLLLVVAGATWIVVGRALAPVEAMRGEVDAISAGELHRRVPEPRGRDEIARLAATMNGMLARLEEAHARQRRFVSDASHELRSPVAAIRQHAEVALAHADGTSSSDLAGVVLEEGMRLQSVVEDLLFLSSSDEGTLRMQMSSVDVDDLVFEEATRMRLVNGIRVDTSGVSAGRVSGDAGHLRRLLRNLTDNAVRHARGSVALALAEDDGEVVLRVDDDGTGIPASERHRVFDRFVRLEEARDRRSGGSGLGLSIVAEIAAAHGGSVVALESPLGGARIEVRLPRLSD